MRSPWRAVGAAAVELMLLRISTGADLPVHHVRLLPELKAPRIDVYFVYPEELRSSKRVSVFRDFMLERLQELG